MMRLPQHRRHNSHTHDRRHVGWSSCKQCALLASGLLLSGALLLLVYTTTTTTIQQQEQVMTWPSPEETNLIPPLSHHHHRALQEMTITNKPILFLHGVSAYATDFTALIDYINAQYANPPPLYAIDICQGTCSLLTPMNKQRDDLVQYLVRKQDEWGLLETGFHMIGYSQGALTMRSVLQALPSSLAQRVDTFVSLAGPQAGQWGPCSMNNVDGWANFQKTMARPFGWITFYTPVGQALFSFANYWRDPRYEALMARTSTFLPNVNGYYSSSSNNVNALTSVMSKAKSNMIHIQGKAVFLGSDTDDCINPPLSSVFGFYQSDGRTPTTLYDSQEWQFDEFGLQTLSHQGKLHVQQVPNLLHGAWVQPAIFEQYVLPHLLMPVPTTAPTASPTTTWNNGTLLEDHGINATNTTNGDVPFGQQGQLPNDEEEIVMLRPVGIQP